VSTRAIAEFLGVRFQTQPQAAPRIAAAPGGDAGEVLDMLIAEPLSTQHSALSTKE